jgi:hypothetical protein
MKAALTAIAGIIIIALCAIWEGFVLCKLWAWFIVDFFGAPALTITTAIGMSIIASHLNHSNTSSDKTGFWETVLCPACKGVFGGAVALLAGWIVTWFM